MTFHYHFSEICYDLKNRLYVLGDVSNMDAHVVHQMQDVLEGGNADIIGRWVDLAVSEVADQMSPLLTRVDAGDTPSDNLPHPVEEYVLQVDWPSLNLPSWKERLRLLIHEYVVVRVFALWLAMVSPGDVQYWQMSAEQTLLQLKRFTFSRWKNIRLRVDPF